MLATTIRGLYRYDKYILDVIRYGKDAQIISQCPWQMIPVCLTLEIATPHTGVEESGVQPVPQAGLLSPEH